MNFINDPTLRSMFSTFGLQQMEREEIPTKSPESESVLEHITEQRRRAALSPSENLHFQLGYSDNKFVINLDLSGHSTIKGRIQEGC